MTSIVLDASVTMTWCFPDEHREYAYAVLDALENTPAIVPSLWPIEVANAILMGERRHRLSPADVARFFDLLNGFSIRVDTQTADRVFAHTLVTARTHRLSAYDAAYLELAMRQQSVLATLDEQLRTAARASGVPLFA